MYKEYVWIDCIGNINNTLLYLYVNETKHGGYYHLIIIWKTGHHSQDK